VNTFAQGSVLGCSLAEAIASINAGADGGGCVAFLLPPYGTNDTIFLPFGTYNFTVANGATASIPTLSEWAQLIMVALLIVGGLFALRRRSLRLRPS
jgi:hypothetical protein